MEITKYNEIFKRKKYLVSLSIFKMIDGYRKFDIYMNYIKRILNYFKNKKLIYDLRIYFDHSCEKYIFNLINENKNISFIEFYKYNYQPLRIDEFHNGTFGTLSRLLPIFENEYDYVWIDDIDINPENINNEQLEYMIKNNINTFYSSLFCYLKPWNNEKYGKYNLNFPLITNIKIPIEIFNRYINDIKNDKYKNIVEKILEYRQDRYKYNYDIKFPYGMDEYFTNNIIFNFLCSKKTFIKYDYDIARLLKKIYHTKKLDTKDHEIIKSLLDLGETSYKNSDHKIKAEINNTFIKLFNKLEKNKIIKYLDTKEDNNEITCVREFYEFLNNNSIDDINNLYKIIEIKL